MNIISLLVIFSSLGNAYGSLTEAVKKQFPSDCNIKKETIFLKKKFEDKSFVLRFKPDCEKGYFYLDNHIVRTMNEVVLVGVKDRTLNSFKVIEFFEPKEYKAKKSWLSSIIGKKIDQLKVSNVDAMTGATLTRNAVVKSVERTFKLHSHIENE